MNKHIHPSIRILVAASIMGALAACQQPANDTAANQSSQPAMTSSDHTTDSAIKAHEQGVQQWRQQRVERLAAKQGWLTLVGLHWLNQGTQSVGLADDNQIQLRTGPSQAGSIEWMDGKIFFTPVEGSAFTINDDGQPLTDRVELIPDSQPNPSKVWLGEGQSFVVIERGGKMGLRVRDDQAKTRTNFQGIPQFDVDPSWRIEAEFTPHPEGKTIDIASIINTIDPTPNPGKLTFQKEGQTFTLEALDGGDDALFVIFADRTNKEQTYGAGRFVYVDKPKDGKVTIDFNRAYNPPCAFNRYSTCPLPPPENRLNVAVTAGEKRYLGPH